MIKFKTLVSQIETYITSAASGKPYHFKLFSGTGKYKKSTRVNNVITPYINGVMSVISSETSNSQTGIEYATMTCLLQVAIPLINSEEDGSLEVINIDGTTSTSQQFKGNESRIDDVRSILDTVFAQNRSFSITENSKTYNVSVVFQPAQDGERDITGDAGRIYTLNSYLFFSIVQSGVNTRDATFKIDGVVLPLESVNVERTPTFDSYVIGENSNGTAENLASQEAFSVKIQMPAYANNTTKSVLSFLLGANDLNTAHIVEVNIYSGVGNKPYLMTISSETLSGVLTANMGHTLTCIPVVQEYEFLNFADSASGLYLHIYDLTSAPSVSISSWSSGNVAFDFETKTFHSAAFTPSHGTASSFIISTAEISALSSYKIQ